MPATALDQLCVNTLRCLAIDGVQKANSGHPGLPLGSAPMAYVLWHKHLAHNPANPRWSDRDRFVLSAGHGSMLLYSLLHLTGYALSMEDLKSFRQWDSKTPGHPEFGLTPGVEATTGPLGQGTANAVGMAISERALAARYNKPGHTIVDHWTYALCGDGDLMEGISSEAASLAGHLKLGKLVMLYDSNDISLDGPTSLSFSEDSAKRYEAYGWRVLKVERGNDDLDAIDAALATARKVTDKPTLIVVRTTIGFGSPNKAGSCKVHGAPLGPDEMKLTKKALGFDPESSFFIPPEAGSAWRSALTRGAQAEAAWKQRFAAYAKAFPELAREFESAQRGELPHGWDGGLPSFAPGSDPATREAGGKAVHSLGERIPYLLGGDADLSESTKTALEGQGNFDGQSGAGRNLRYGVREHAMGAIANGIAYHGGLVTYTATFFAFADYMRPAIRLAALNHLPVIFVFTHDSVALGEDGPTHQPVEQLASLRCMPNVHVVRPSDGNETSEGWRYALNRKHGPTVIVLSRQKLPVIDRKLFPSAAGLAQGAYVLRDTPGGAPEVALLATGSEVLLALKAQTLLEARGLRSRVVSMPCWEAFSAQPAGYRESVLPSRLVARVAIEAAASFGWERWVGLQGEIVALERFGTSAPGPIAMEKLGITAERLAERALAVVERLGAVAR